MVQNTDPLPLMECGHTAQGRDGNGAPVCVIHAGTDPGARIVHTDPPDLTGRVARCSYSRAGLDTHGGGGQYRGTDFKSTQPSAFNLPFFQHKPEESEDQFYCGCWGWD